MFLWKGLSIQVFICLNSEKIVIPWSDWKELEFIIISLLYNREKS